MTTVGEALLRSLAWDHERVQVVHDPQTGLQAVIAIHSTVLGPALGGLRLRRYAGGLPEALDDALRLSRAMTMKASAAGLDLGGGKAVIVDDGRDDLREPRLVAMAREIDRLGGAYITAEDIGTTTADMDLIAERTPHVVGRSLHNGIGGDPSPDTARTVLGAIRAALSALDGDDALAGRSVGVIGLGKVGGRLARMLAEAGAEVVGYDPAPDACAALTPLGIEIATSAEGVLARQLDVLAPCAGGGMIDVALAARLRCRIVCGAANNPLSDVGAADALARRGILSVPDFLANCGGLIRADAERRGDADRDHVERQLAAAQERTREVLVQARERGLLPELVAEAHALERIDAARAGAPAAVGG
jgi:glutamate dehydrogenase/leucine dehydrogenase